MSLDSLSTPIHGLSIVDCSSHFDSRGCFRNIFKASDPNFSLVWGNRSLLQVNLSTNFKVGQIRGLHYQKPPNSEAKLVVCISGRVFDVAVDMRDDSPTKYKWFSIELDSSSDTAIFIPEGFAHGFQVLEPNTQLLYLHSGTWLPHTEAGVRFDDPILSITWPLSAIGISERDLELPFLIS